VLIRVIRGKAFGFAVAFGVVFASPAAATRNLALRIAQQFCRGTCFLATATGSGAIWHNVAFGFDLTLLIRR
jgi:hypothetical protein